LNEENEEIEADDQVQDEILNEKNCNNDNGDEDVENDEHQERGIENNYIDPEQDLNESKIVKN